MSTMKSSKPSITFNPFGDLKSLLEDRPIPAARVPADGGKDRMASEHRRTDDQMFREAMEGVIPIERDNCVTKNIGAVVQPGPEKEDALLELKEIVASGKGFILSHTPEYIEGAGYEMNIGFARRLHRGDFSIQAYLDLHGLTAEEARGSVEAFLQEAVASGKRAVSVIHGRGLSSPGEPVLKNKVVEWITSGRWRKWVMAYSSAQACDGGAGATYVLLRRRPYSRRSRRRSPEGREPGSERS